MATAGSVNLSTSGSIFLIILFTVLLAAYSYYIYKHTIPRVSRKIRFTLIALRLLAIILLLFIIFEPVLTIIKHENVESKTFVFVDNSGSIASKDSARRNEQEILFAKEITSDSAIRNSLFVFGEKIDSLSKDQLMKINLTSTKTNYINIIDFIRKHAQSVNAVVILSDGIITDGIDPSFQAEKLQVPVFTVGIGDTSQNKDAEIYNAIYNQMVYMGKETSIEIAVRNFGYTGKPAKISLFEEDKIIDTKDIVLNESGLNKITFSYKPKNAGEKKLSAVLSPLAGEYTSQNNKRTFYINVLDAKLKIGIVSGSPSADVSAMVTALSSDKNLIIKKLIQISSNKFWNDASPGLIDSADILMLVDFPAVNTPQNIIDKVIFSISQGKPFFFLLSPGVSLSRLPAFNRLLPFSVSNNSNDHVDVQPEIENDYYSAYFSNQGNRKDVWDNLPPVSQFAVGLNPLPGTNVIIKSRIKNVSIPNPLVVVRSLGKQRVFAVLCGEIWKWQLNTAEKEPVFFDNFMNDVVKWLSLSAQQKQLNVTTDKKIYSIGEQIEFRAELYDQTFAPVDTAKMELNLLKNGKTINIVLSPAGSGIYTGEYIPNEPGDYTFETSANLGGSKIKSNTGRISVSETQIERIDTRMKVDFLKSLARSTDGDFYSIDNYGKLLKRLKDINKTTFKEYSAKSELQLWSNKWMLIIIILLFASEWFLRKRAGMI